MPAVVLEKLLRVAKGIKDLSVAREVVVVRKLRLQHKPGLVRRLEELGHLAARMKPDVVEARRLHLADVAHYGVPVWEHRAVHKPHRVPAYAAHEERTPVEEELSAARLEFPHAETLLPLLYDCAVLYKFDGACVEVRMIRRPGAEGGEGKFQGEG